MLETRRTLGTNIRSIDTRSTIGPQQGPHSGRWYLLLADLFK